jgi:hypothetical protein
MRFAKSTALVLALSIATASTAALASGREDVGSCLAASKQVSAALGTASQNADAARQESKAALEFCNRGFYHQGMIHYAKAMELLGLKG